MWNSNIGKKITFCYNAHKDLDLNQKNYINCRLHWHVPFIEDLSGTVQVVW